MTRQNVAVLTTARSEYYQWRSVLKSLSHSKTLSLRLLVSGSHLSERYGRTISDIERDGYCPAEVLPILLDADTSLASAMTAGLLVQQLAGALVRQKIDLLLLLGDRYETLAAALAAACLGIPVAHLHGGEVTTGANDDAFRHAITKLSALHFVSTDVYRERVLQLGEAPDRVFRTGAPFLDEILATKRLSRKALETRLGIKLISPVALVAYHPATASDECPEMTCRWLLESVKKQCRTILLTAPNQDPGRDRIWHSMETFAKETPGAKCFVNLGSQVFLSVMGEADVMVGNSSSGIHEAASFKLPVVNIGSRQEGRLAPANVLHCASSRKAIEMALKKALSPAFRKKLASLKNPFGDGHAAERIVKTLEKFVPFREQLSLKSFEDSVAVRRAMRK